MARSQCGKGEFLRTAVRVWQTAFVLMLGFCLACNTFEPSLSAQAPGLKLEHIAQEKGREPHFGMYVPPNEQHPAVAMPIWAKSNHGAYVSVGTERSFIGAAVTRAAALVVIDYDSAVVQFTTINRALLAASANRDDYITLRLAATQDIWASRASQVAFDDAKTLRDKDSWKFWNDNVRQNTNAWSAAFQHFNQQSGKPDGPFAQTNYMFDDQFYQHLHELAKNGHIWTRTADLRDETSVRKLCRDMRASGMTLGVVDTSNVADTSEAGQVAAGNYVAWFSECAEDSTLFLSTERANRQSDSYWSYFAFTGKVVKGRDAATIARWYTAEIAKLQADSQTRAYIDDPTVIAQ